MSKCNPNLVAPAPVPTGTNDYYERRRLDFKRRHPTKPAPSYYRGYGTKYLVKFTKLDCRSLSPAGLIWRTRTRNKLQEAIENLRKHKCDEFARSELKDAEFTKFAFGTHPDAYIAAGLFTLPARDLIVILDTIKDELLHPFADSYKWRLVVDQMFTVIRKAKPGDYKRILVETIQDPRMQIRLRLPQLNW